MRWSSLAIAAVTTLLLLGCGSVQRLAANSPASDSAAASAAGLISPAPQSSPAPQATPLRSEAPASIARQEPAASQARLPECIGASVKATVGGLRYMETYAIGQPLTVASTAVNVSGAPCQFSSGYCPDVQILGPAGITDRWYDSRGRGCADDHPGYVLLPGHSLTVTQAWDQKSCANASGTCHFQDGWPPPGQYQVHFSWGDPDDLIPDAPRAWLNFNLSARTSPSPAA